MKKIFAIGDIHGNYKALKQCLERSNFNYEEDRLIVLGDVCDGWHEVPKCFDELLKIKDLVYILGNHDWWARQYFTGASSADIYWLTQGGYATFNAYSYTEGMTKSHLDMLINSKYTHTELISGEMYVFVHGGIDPNQKDLNKQDPENCLWDRDLLHNAYKAKGTKPDLKYGGYGAIFVGHTTTQRYSPLCLPLNFCNVWDLDTGAGWEGKLTIMNVRTKEYWQSDMSSELYPGMRGRK